MQKEDVEFFKDFENLAVVIEDKHSVSGSFVHYGYIERLSQDCLILKTYHGPVLISYSNILEIRPAKKFEDIKKKSEDFQKWMDNRNTGGNGD